MTRILSLNPQLFDVFACANASSCPRYQGGRDSFRLDGKGAHGQPPERAEHLDAHARRRMFHQFDRIVVIHILPGRPDPGHPGKFRVGNLSQPAWFRLEPESQFVREHHGDVRCAIRNRAPDGNGVRHPAVGKRMAVHEIIPARRQRQGGGRAERVKNPVIANVEIDRSAGMTIRQDDEKAGGRFLQRLDRKRNVFSDDMVHQIRQVNDGFVVEKIGSAHHLAGQFPPDGQARFPQAGDKISRRTGAGRSRIDEVVLPPSGFMEKGEHAGRPRSAHGSALHNQRRFALIFRPDDSR